METKRKLFREDLASTDGTTWCEVTIELRDREEGPELSITGLAGYTLTPAQARRQAREGWESYFEEDREALAKFAIDHGKRTPRTAAKYVVDVDGQYHGLDVHEESGNRVYVCHCAGQIREEIARFFPEVIPFFEWHLNGMNAGCEHQRKLGWGHGKTIALSPDDLTDAQRETLANLAEGRANKARAKLIIDSRLAGIRALEELLGRKISVLEGELWSDGNTMSGSYEVYNQLMDEVKEAARRKIPAEPFEGAIYKDSLEAPCPVCGYRYGTKWLYRELPQEVITWAKGE